MAIIKPEAMDFSNKNVIMIISGLPGTGKTTLALSAPDVLLIDADMRKSVMAGRKTDAKPQGGLSEVLSGLAELEDCLWSADGSGFHVLFSGAYPPNPTELLNSDSFLNLLRMIRDQYDYVIIDTPPLGRVIDAAVIASYVDGCAIVVGDERLKNRQMSAMISQLEKSECRILGLIRNKHNSGYQRHGYYAAKKNK